jgi:hypothetical protein
MIDINGLTTEPKQLDILIDDFVMNDIKDLWSICYNTMKSNYDFVTQPDVPMLKYVSKYIANARGTLENFFNANNQIAGVTSEDEYLHYLKLSKDAIVTCYSAEHSDPKPVIEQFLSTIVIKRLEYKYKDWHVYRKTYSSIGFNGYAAGYVEALAYYDYTLKLAADGVSDDDAYVDAIRIFDTNIVEEAKRLAYQRATKRSGYTCPCCNKRFCYTVTDLENAACGLYSLPEKCDDCTFDDFLKSL